MSDNPQTFDGKIIEDDVFTDSMKSRKKFKDAADAAQAAFESATFAASAARAAVELSRTGPHDFDDQSSPDIGRRKTSERYEHMILESEHKTGEIQSESQAMVLNQDNNAAEKENVMSISSSDSVDDNVKVSTVSLDEVDPVKLLEKDMVLDESDEEDSDLSPKRVSTKSFDDVDPVKMLEKDIVFGESDEEDAPLPHKGLETKQLPLVSGLQSKHHVAFSKGPMSVRTRRVSGY